MEKGKVKWYNDIKGYGFIESEQGADIFVHKTGLANPGLGLEDDQEVEFEIKEDQKGQSAKNVIILK